MKNFINKTFSILMIGIVVYTSTGTAFAQFDDYNYDMGSYDWGSSYDYNSNSYDSSYNYNTNSYNSGSSYDYNYNSTSYDWGDSTNNSTPNSSYNYSNWTYQNIDDYNYNYGSYTNPNVDVVSTDCVGCGSSYNYSNWMYQDINDYNYNYGSYTNPNVDVVSTDCVGCDSSYNYSNWTYQNIDDYNYNYGSYTNPNVDVVSTDCVGCGSYTAPTYTNPTYTAPTYTNPVYTAPTYTSPTYTNPTYTNPTYTAPTYTAPTYTNPVYTAPTYTNPVYTPTPTTHTTVCADGYAPVLGSCNRTTTLPVTTTTVCADGLAPVAGSCTRTTTIPVTTLTNCSDGLPRNANGTCIRTNTIPVTTATVCSDGLAPVGGSCVRTTTLPTTTVVNCSDGLPRNTDGTCTRIVTAPTVTYQTCWDNSVIPLSATCPVQYKTCANGTSIPVTQTCYYGNTQTPPPAPVVIKFNNVITSVATEITTTSARCNGIGLIASGAVSTGWFEYGETPNLGRETAKANIGSSATAPFSNVLANLKPTTTYYCRAVMQNQYGVVKGEVVAFTTKTTAVSYVKPVTSAPVTKPTTKTEIACVDGSTVKVGSKTSAALLNEGQKLVSLQIEKTSGNLSSGSSVGYKLTFKNLSDETLRNLVIKVTVPQEVVVTNASSGSYDPITHIITVNHSALAAYGEGSVTWSGVVAKDASVGKSLVTTAYTNYAVPGTEVEDEVTAYVVGSVVPGTDTASSTGAKNVVGASSDRGFLPDSLVEWLALIAIIFIVFILGRSVYSSYSTDRKAAH